MIEAHSIPVANDLREYPCGCVNGIDMEWGVMRRVQTCPGHQAEGGKTGLQHYIDMGCIVDGVPQHAKYCRELKDALFQMEATLLPWRVNGEDSLFGNSHAMEIGSGLSMYTPMVLEMAYKYEGIEPDREAATWASSTFATNIFTEPLERFFQYMEYQLVIAAHVFEHIADAPEMLLKTWSMLVPLGRLILIVPNGEDDPVNPDHRWFFTPATLRSTLERIGLTDVRIIEKQIVKRERFIYCSALKI